jgi:hypothetical protein
MQSASWGVLLRLIPPAQHDNLILMTTVGIEMAVQKVLRVEEAYVVIRGRMAGTSDTGRVFFIPYNQINFLGFQKPMKEADVWALYGESPPAAETAQPESAPAAGAEPPATPAVESPPATEPPPVPDPEPTAPKPDARPSLPSKATLLERLRARTAAAAAKPPDK